MQQLDRSMQESSRGASPEWIALRDVSIRAGSARIDQTCIKNFFHFVADDVSIGRVVRESSANMVPSAKNNFVVDSPILSVI